MKLTVVFILVLFAVCASAYSVQKHVEQFYSQAEIADAIKRFDDQLDEDFHFFNQNITDAPTNAPHLEFNTYLLRRPLKGIPFRLGDLSHSAVVAQLNDTHWWLYEFGPEKEEGLTFIGPGKIHQYIVDAPSSQTLKDLYFQKLVTLVPSNQEQPTYKTWKLHNAKNIITGYLAVQLRQIMEIHMPLRYQNTDTFLYHIFYQNCHTAVRTLYSLMN